MRMLRILITVSSLYALQGFKVLCPTPVCLQLGLVYLAPFFDDGCHLAGKFTFGHFASGDVDQRFKPLVFHMNVGRWVVLFGI